MYEIYLNIPTKMITLHIEGCYQLHKHGKTTTSNGKYFKKQTKEESYVLINDYIKEGYSNKECSSCMKR